MQVKESPKATNPGVRGAVLVDRTCRGLQRVGPSPGSPSSTDIRMVEKKKAPKRGRRSPLGDRRQFLTMMSPDVIKSVKQAGIEDDRPAWQIMEEAAKQWLERRKGRRGA
jgi:hypothetical protein